jgi:hypothetical protein
MEVLGRRRTKDRSAYHSVVPMWRFVTSTETGGTHEPSYPPALHQKAARLQP